MSRARTQLTALACCAAVLLALAGARRAAPAARPVAATSDPWLRHHVSATLDSIYGFDVETTRRELAAISARYPGHPINSLLLAQWHWWWILADPEDRSRDAPFMAQVEKALEGAERRLERRGDDADGRYVKAAALGFRGRLRSLRGEWVPAAYDAHRSLGLVRQIAHAQPHNEDVLLGLGLYDYFAAVAPERYPALRPLALFFPEGDRERGLERLQRASERGHMGKIEATYFLLQIHYHFEEDYLASLRYVQELRRRFPHNPIFHTYEGRVHARFARWERAVPVLREVLARQAAGRPGYGAGQSEQALYTLVRCLMAQGDHTGALEELQRLQQVAAPRNSGFVALAHLRRGMALDALGTRGAAVHEYRRVLSLPDVGDAHQFARRFLKSPYAG